VTNKKCDEKVIYHIERGIMRFVEVPVPCGNTDPYGSVALCPKCEHKRKSINERSAYINSLAPSNWGEF